MAIGCDEKVVLMAIPVGWLHTLMQEVGNTAGKCGRAVKSHSRYHLIKREDQWQKIFLSKGEE